MTRVKELGLIGIMTLLLTIFISYPVFAAEEATVVAVYGGNNHSVALKSDGTVWVWGSNMYGQLGRSASELSQVSAAIKVQGLSNIKAIAAGFYHTLALRADGTVCSWGLSSSGSITEYPGLEDIISITAGDGSNFAIEDDGSVWAWGDNTYGSLGLGDQVTYINIPTKIEGLSDIVQVSPAKFGDYSLTAFLDKYGHVWVTGNGQQYTPVILSNINEVKQVSSTMAENYIYALKNEGTVWKIGLDSVPTQVYGLSDIESIATGYEHSLALKNDGSIWSWGGNHFGELGLGYYSSKVTTPERIPNFNASFVGGSSIMNSFAIDSNGVAWSWGYDGVGLLGDGYNYISNGYVLNRGSNVPVKILFDEEPPIVTANPPAGNYNSSQNITLNSSELAYILYTTDGTEPSTNNPTIYTQPITISETTTLRFMAIDAGGHRSEVYTANYIIGAIPPKVFMNTAEILDSSDMLITLTSSETEAAIYYTLDGTVPTQNSMQYNSPITLSAGQNLKIKAIDQAGNMSPTYQFSFSD